MELEVSISLPQIWGDKEFSQNEWGGMNYFIGPNGSGKTLFAETLEDQIHSYDTRYLSAERLTGMESNIQAMFFRSQINDGMSLNQEDQYFRHARDGGLSSDAYLKLRKKPDLRTKIQSILSEFFDREIDLVEEAGNLKPEMRDTNSSDRYNLRENESHGLKELISLLTHVHDDEYDILIVDEPELHLHPQYQRFLLQEIRDIAGNPNEKGSRAFFLITHSPSMIEIREPDDLTNIYSFRDKNRPPFSISEFTEQDEYYIRKLLPRLNTRHKEILFSKKPVLVEGHTDEQIFSLFLEKHSEIRANPESILLGVGGKNELDTFLRLCRNLGLKPKCIADLDVLFEGDLRQTLSETDSVKELVASKGLGSNLMEAIGDVESGLNSIIESIEQSPVSGNSSTNISDISNELEEAGEMKNKRNILARSLVKYEDSIREYANEDEVEFVVGRIDNIIDNLVDCGYHLLEKGELEDYLEEDYPISGRSQDNKASLFRETRQQLLDAKDESELSASLSELYPVLAEVTEYEDIDLIKHLNDPVSDWVHDVQKAIRKGEIRTREDLVSHDDVGKDQYGRLFTVESIEVSDTNFNCTIRIDSRLDSSERSWKFSDETVPASIDLRDCSG